VSRGGHQRPENIALCMQIVESLRKAIAQMNAILLRR
jgi:hypothetical protein